MKQSVQLSDAVHIMVYITVEKDPALLKSRVIASSIQTNPSNVRKIMANLKKSGLIVTQQGKVTPQLARPAEAISLLDIFKSLPGDNHLLQVDTKTNMDCVIGANIQDTLKATYDKLQANVEKEMAEISLAQLTADLSEKAIAKDSSQEQKLSDFVQKREA
ncbi:MAG: Rrf2 family transcriptional regulator [Streptococcus hyointestinalis]|nr:Rrf2 family transcriptional regulator [Streptococcus hyointestinalis]MDD6384894.1 Rrf2 family transcriptional regulator [Streptococcus hyointestinalis]